MRWISHMAIAGAICAVFNPVAIPAALAGSTAPDWFEMLVRSRNRRVKHRAVTHYLVFWVFLMLFAQLIFDWRWLLFWFAFGGASHWFCDALTVTGAPVGWWSDRRMTLFGGKVYTGSPAEYIIAGLTVIVCGAIIWVRGGAGSGAGFVPFFIPWADLYQQGVISGHEWRANRFNFF